MWETLFQPGTPIVRSCVEAMVRKTGREIVNREEKEGVWTLFVKQNTYLVFLLHIPGEQFFSVVFPARFTDEAILAKIEGALQNPADSAKFYYQLKKAISTPQSAFFIYMKENRFTGFDSVAKIFPFERAFGIRELETAIQTVVATGLVGMAYISTILGEQELEQQALGSYPKTSPEGMFG